MVTKTISFYRLGMPWRDETEYAVYSGVVRSQKLDALLYSFMAGVKVDPARFFGLK